MDVRQLNTFLHVAELGSVSKAAQRLRIAQPALSRQLRLLEAELRVPLFTRHGRGMVLTDAGETLRVRASSILRQIEATRADLAQDAAALRGRVVFGMPPTVGEVLAARLIERFLALHPDVSLRFVSASSGYLADWLHSGEVDIAVIYGADQADHITVSPLLAENLFFITAADPGAAAADAISFAELARQRLVLSGPHHGLRILLEREARQQGLSLDIRIEADAPEVLKGLVARRLGGTVLPLGTVHREVAAGLLTATPILQPQLHRRLVVAQPLGRPVPHAVDRFRQVLQQEVRTMVEAGIWHGQLPD